MEKRRRQEERRGAESRREQRETEKKAISKRNREEGNKQRREEDKKIRQAEQKGRIVKLFHSHKIKRLLLCEGGSGAVHHVHPPVSSRAT